MAAPVPIGPNLPIETANLSFVEEVLNAALYGKDPLMAVPWLQVISSIAHVVSLAILILGLLRVRRRARRAAHKDAWVLLNAATPGGSDTALCVYMIIGTVAFTFSALVLLLLCLPITHLGPFASAVYVGQGLVDALPLVWATQDDPKFARSTAARFAVLLGVVAVARTVAVAGQPPGMAFAPGASVRANPSAALCPPPSRTSPPRRMHRSSAARPPLSSLCAPAPRACTSSRRASTPSGC